MKTTEINWKTTKADSALITKIIDRATHSKFGVPKESLSDLRMDITACHLNGCKLDLAKLLAADDFNFAHDVLGIMRHMDRSNGQLKNCFVPRTSKPSTH